LGGGGTGINFAETGKFDDILSRVMLSRLIGHEQAKDLSRVSLLTLFNGLFLFLSSASPFVIIWTRNLAGIGVHLS